MNPVALKSKFSSEAQDPQPQLRIVDDNTWKDVARAKIAAIEIFVKKTNNAEVQSPFYTTAQIEQQKLSGNDSNIFASYATLLYR